MLKIPHKFWGVRGPTSRRHLNIVDLGDRRAQHVDTTGFWTSLGRKLWVSDCWLPLMLANKFKYEPAIEAEGTHTPARRKPLSGF